MKKIYCLFIMILALGLTGCSFGSKDKKEEKKEKKEPEIDIVSEPLEVDPSLFKYTGSFKQTGGDIAMNAYVVSNNNSLSIDFIIPGSYFSFDSTGENDPIDQTIGFEVDKIENDEIIVDDEFLGLKGTIKKVEGGYDVDLTLKDASFAIKIEGKFDKVESITDFQGYFVDGDFKAVAITPLTDNVMVSYTAVVQGFYNSSDIYCDYKDSKIICDDDNKITITKTEKGIKVDTKDKKIKGEYEVK